MLFFTGCPPVSLVCLVLKIATIDSPHPPTQIMCDNFRRVPTYQYYTALGQLLSRVCHEVPTVVTALVDLVVRVFESYPHQTIWFLMSMHYVSSTPGVVFARVCVITDVVFIFVKTLIFRSSCHLMRISCVRDSIHLVAVSCFHEICLMIALYAFILRPFQSTVKQRRERCQQILHLVK